MSVEDRLVPRFLLNRRDVRLSAKKQVDHFAGLEDPRSPKVSQNPHSDPSYSHSHAKELTKATEASQAATAAI
jgi:hypothetical protein